MRMPPPINTGLVHDSVGLKPSAYSANHGRRLAPERISLAGPNTDHHQPGTLAHGKSSRLIAVLCVALGGNQVFRSGASSPPSLVVELGLPWYWVVFYLVLPVCTLLGYTSIVPI